MNRKGSYFGSSKFLVYSLLLIYLSILLTSLKIFQVEKKALLRQNKNQLESIAQIKINQIIDWRNERLSDARYLSVSPQVNESFRLFAMDTSIMAYRRSLYNNLNGMFLNRKYESMVALNSERKVIFSLPVNDSAVTPFFSYDMTYQSRKSGKVQIRSISLNRDTVPVMQFIIPVTHLNIKDTVVIGWLFLNISLEKTFFPLLETVPIPSKSIEVLLLLKEKNKLQVLNRKGHSVDDLIESEENDDQYGLSLHGILSDSSDSGALYYFKGKTGIATCLSVPGSNTYVLVKMDKSEAYAEVRKIEVIIFALTIMMVIAVTSAILYFWQKQRNEMLLLEHEKMIILERFDMLSKFANDAIILYAKDQAIIQVNNKALELYGYSRKEFLGMHADSLEHPDMHDQMPGVQKKIVEEGGYRYETIHLRKDGTEIPVEVSLSYMEMIGNPCFQCIIRDISHRKLFEKALIESEARLKLITNTMPQIVWTAKPDGKIDFVNSRFEALTGINPFLKRSFIKTLHPGDYTRTKAFWKKAIFKIQEHQIRFRLRMKDATYRWFFCIITPLCREDGSVISWYGSATDIDELEKMVALRTAELSDLYNNAPCGYYTLDNAGIVTKINDTALRWMGYQREEIVNKTSFIDLIAPENNEKIADYYKLFRNGEDVNSMEYELTRKDGTLLPVLLNATAIRDMDNNIIMIRSTIIDHTVRKRYENEILKLNAILREHGYNLENINNELEAFIFSVSHDLRAPLRAINGFTRILLDDYTQGDDEARNLLEKVWDNANKMKQLIDDLLRLSRTSRQELSLTLIDMRALFISMIEETKQLYPDKKINATVKIVPKANADIALLKQVISNLLSNAVKFSGKKEVTEIEIGSVEGEKDWVYYVKDNGIGFDMKFAQDLFGVFRRLCNTEEYEGTGVGLALVKRIVERHGGKVWAVSESGKGATFYFSIPENKTV